MSSKMNTTLRLVRCPKCRKVLPEPPDVPVYECGGCGAVLQAKKRKNDTVDTTIPRKLEEDSTGKLKMEQVSDDQKPSSSTNHSINEPNVKTSDHNDVPISSDFLGQDQDAAKKVENCMVDAVASNAVKEYSSGKQKMKQLSNDEEACSSSNQQSLVISSIDEPDPNSYRNDPRSSTELSGHGDPESSPEATAHNRKDQDEVQEPDHALDSPKNRSRSRSPEAVVHDRIDEDRELINNGDSENCENEVEFEDSSRELTTSPEKCSFSEVNEIQKSSRKPIADRKIDRDSNRGSKSSFKSLIAEKLLDTRQKKVVYMDEDDILSEDGSADLCHRRRLFDRISSEETLENARFGGTSYEYEGSVSSFDGTDNQISTKKHVDSVISEYHQKHHRREFHPSVRSRRGKDEHRSMQFQPFYGNAIPSRHRPPVNVNEIPGNPKMERLELLKMVRNLQDQLERTKVSNSAQLPPSYYYDHGLNHPRRFGQRMAFSGEVDRRRDSGSGSGTCHNCYPQPQERHFSAQQIPRPHSHVCCNGPHYVPSTCYTSESDFSTPEPDNHRHRIDVPKPTYNKSPKKRYVRPISGGSPWIACYRCSEVLQLPQSFLVFKKRCHSLRCGACEKVLNFTVSDGTHVHRYYPEETMAAPPSSEVEDYGDVRVGLGPVSCSDISFQKSYSTETDRNGSREFVEDRRKAGPSRPSSSRASGRRKVTSEIEEIEPANNGSPLHWLMGYASPSKVIRG